MTLIYTKSRVDVVVYRVNKLSILPTAIGLTAIETLWRHEDGSLISDLLHTKIFLVISSAVGNLVYGATNPVPLFRFVIPHTQTGTNTEEDKS